MELLKSQKLHRKAHAPTASEPEPLPCKKPHISWSGLLIHILTAALSFTKKFSQEELLVVPRFSAVTLWTLAFLWKKPIFGAQPEESEVTKMTCPRDCLKRGKQLPKPRKYIQLNKLNNFSKLFQSTCNTVK